jgi:alkanesulfonate monooxygenase SsuD/methylene tetrahydromethanopterin reductase-like flavin-dependent oxidoreductase (luciferase family)
LLRGASTAFDRSSTLEQSIEAGIVFAGNPDTVYRQIRRHYEHVGGYGNLLMMGQAGFLEHEETVRGMTSFANEVYPRLKELFATAR